MAEASAGCIVGGGSAGMVLGYALQPKLAAVQRRRAWPTRMTQRIQVMIQDRILRPALRGTGPATPPILMRAFAGTLLLRRIPARVIGLGSRPEHVAPAIRSGRFER